MNRSGIRQGGMLLALAFCGLATPAEAAISTKPAALSDVIEASTYIFTATVDAVDPDKPSMVLTLGEHLKGKFSFQRLPINLKGDSDSDKLKHRPLLLKRVAPKVPAIVFVTVDDKELIALCYVNGTWFQMTGEKPDGADTVRWSFTHIEPYFRRTYKGTTAEMKQTLTDALSGKKKPPPVNAKEEPGVGPELEPEKPKEKKDGAGVPIATGPVFAVIPAVMVGGPLALLALLFPSIFGGWKRWLSLISVTCTTSTIYWMYYFFAPPTSVAWWNSTFCYWLLMTLVTLGGAFWAWQRHIQRLMVGEAPLRPVLVEQFIMAAVSLFAFATLCYYRWDPQSLLKADGLPVIVFAAGIWSGTLFVLFKGNLPAHLPVLATEVVVLTTMAFVSTALVFFTASSNSATPKPLIESVTEKSPELLWRFDLPAKGAVASSPLVVGDRVFIAAAHDNVFRPFGALYCLDCGTGKPIWSFNNGKKMKQVFSTPAAAGDFVYIGEGFHQDSVCRIYCLKAATGEKAWEFETQSHTESSPCVVDSRVYCGAGDDGLYCLEAATGKEAWHFNGFHVDAGPVVAGDCVYCGAGIGDVYKETIFFCLNAKDGGVKWKIATEQPVWSSPSVDGGKVYFGMGNGRLNESDPHPAGAVVCVDAETGKDVWRRKLPDAVLCRPVVDAGYVYFGCRDGNFYCVNRHNGKDMWQAKLGGPVVATAALASDTTGGPTSQVYIPAANGQVYCLAADTGKVRWLIDVGANLQASPELFSSPFVEESQVNRRIYFGQTLVTTSRAGSLACYQEVSKKDKE